jgi:pimeloyl-ACP methyl ester carboxylesterase
MWWWLMNLAPGAAEALIVGNERSYLSWFYGRAPGTRAAIGDALEEYLRTFAGAEGVLGALGVYRAAFTTVEQTESLARRRITTPVTAIGGEFSRGAELMESMVTRVAERVTAVCAAGAGHLVPEERPDVIVDAILAGPLAAGTVDSTRSRGPAA